MKKIRKLILFVLIVLFQMSFINLSLYCIPENSKQECCCSHNNSVHKKSSDASIKVKAPMCILVDHRNSNDEILPFSTQQYSLNGIFFSYALKTGNEIGSRIISDSFSLPESIYLFSSQRSPPVIL